MARVHPDDDSIQRWIVYHYRYDPDRRERRNVAVAAFDNPAEFHDDIEERSARLRAGKASGADVDPGEHLSGQLHQPGYQRLQQNARLLRRAIEHGVAPSHIEDLDLPLSIAALRAHRRGP